LAIFSAKYISECSEKITQNISIIYIFLTTLITLPIVILSFVNFDINVDLVSALLVFVLCIGSSFAVFKKIPNSDYLKPAYLGVVFIISLIISANHIFNKNESKINSVKPIAEFIKSQHNSEIEVLVYNYLLPSLAFYLEKDITTINHGRHTTQREIQFETNDNWKKNLINYFDKTDRERVLNYTTEKPLYLIKRKKEKFPDTLNILKARLKNKKEFGKFEVYY
jgi:4-amino-4-deoxy-L-arabinose transferase